MSDVFILLLPPDALKSDAPADLTIRWMRVDGESKQEPLGELLSRLEPSDRVRLVLSATDAHLAQVTLTRKQARHLTQVLPYLLEDDVLGDPADMLLVAGRADQGNYPVAAVAKAPLEHLAGLFRQQHILVDSIRVDADILSALAPCLVSLGNEQSLLMDEEGGFAVVPDADIASFTEGKSPAFQQVSDDAFCEAVIANQGKVELMQLSWKAQQKGGAATFASLWQHWRPALAVAACLIALIWVGMGVQYWRYQAAASQWQQAADTLFEKLFPQDRATAMLRSQFKRHLSYLGSSASGTDFLSLMQKVGPVLASVKSQGLDAQRIRFNKRNGQLVMDVQAGSYQLIQKLRKQLQEAKLKAEIKVAKNHGKQVAASISVEHG